MTPTSTLSSLGEDEVARLQGDPDTANTPDGPADASTKESLSDDELFHLLQNSRRRAVLRYLRGREGPVRMRDVAEQVAAWEHDTTVAQLSSDERQRVYIALYQSHLETLEDAGVIAYNKPRGVVEPRPGLDYVASYADRRVPGGTAAAPERQAREDSAGRSEVRWGRRYLGLSAVVSLLVIGVAADLAVLGSVSGFAASVLVLLSFSLLTLARVALGDGGRAENA